MSIKYGSKVRSARKRAGLTQRELAAKVGRTQVTVCNIENGKLDPGEELAGKLSKVLGV